MAPNTMKQWNVHGQDGFESLKWTENASVPTLGERDVLVKCKFLQFYNHIKNRGVANNDQSTLHPSTSGTSPSPRANTPSPSKKM
jgi:hypothetical protein